MSKQQQHLLNSGVAATPHIHTNAHFEHRLHTHTHPLYMYTLMQKGQSDNFFYKITHLTLASTHVPGFPLGNYLQTKPESKFQ